MSRSVRFVPAMLALALALAGCSRGSDTVAPPYLNQDFADEVAQHVGMTLAAGNGGSMLSLTATAATIRPGAVAQDGARAATDTLFAASGVAWSVSDTFYTAGGTAFTDYDPLATRLSLHATGTGEIIRTAFRATFWHHADLQANGLSAVKDSIVLGGPARDSTRSRFTAKFTNATVRLLCVSSIGHSGVTVLKGQSPMDAPLVGVSDWSMTVTKYDNADTLSVTRQATVDVLVGFDGTNQALLQVGGLYDYQVDLATGDITRGPALALRR